MYFVLMIDPKDLPAELPKERLAGITLVAGTPEGFTSFWDQRQGQLVDFEETGFTQYPQLFKTARGLMGKLAYLRKHLGDKHVWMPALWVSPDSPEPFEKYLLLRRELPGSVSN